MLSALSLPIAVVLALGSPAESQFALHGRVLDPNGAVLPLARVSAVGASSGAAFSTEADTKGAYELVLAPGDYQIRVSAAGFQDLTKALSARAGTSEAWDFTLSPPPFAKAITVSDSAGYGVASISSGTKTSRPLLDLPQAVSVTTKERVQDQLLRSVGDVMRYTPGVQVHQGENNRDQVVIRGQSSSADFFLNGVRDDVQYYRDLYNLERMETLKGPNAMMFGRGGGGGVVNRVTKEALFQPLRTFQVQGGAYGLKRMTADVDQPLTGALALRVNAVYEDSDSYRDFVTLERYGLNPTMTLTASERTRLTFGYEHLHDRRVADRGITSYQGRPADVEISTYYGNPDDSHVGADVDLGTLTLDHDAGSFKIRNRTLLGDYGRKYQNYVPGAVSADKSEVALTAYNNATARDNVFNQTDVTYPFATGGAKHTLLAGAELGRQHTENFRNTGYFNDASTSIAVPYLDPTISTPVTFRQSATDADNQVRANVAAAYVQDEIELSRSVELVAGVRFDRFDLDYHNHRNDDRISRTDDLLSPRAGLVVKPADQVSLYGSYTVSHLPSSGDQFSALTNVTEQLKPERFRNYEVGSKWAPRSGLELTAALYRLDRTNTRSTDPNDPTRVVQTGSQRTDGIELGFTGQATSAWSIAGGYALQDANVTSATASAREGATVGQVPRHTFSIWNRYQFMPRLGLGLGLVSRTDMFATVDNAVTLPGFVRVDLAGFYSWGPHVKLQANLENAFDRNYWLNADSNTNISPGSGRTLRVAISTDF